MKFSAPILALLAIAPSAWADDCETSKPTDTDEVCFDYAAVENDWEPEAGEVCISVTGNVMSVKYEIAAYYSLFNSQIFVGDDIAKIPRDAAGNIDTSLFGQSGVVSEEYRGTRDQIVRVDLPNTALCVNGEYTLTIMAGGLLGDYCLDPSLNHGINWVENTDYYGTAGSLEIEGLQYLTMPIKCECDSDDKTVINLAPPKDPATGSGDPHFKTWTGDKFDYHGECDLVLVDNPSFDNGKGLKVHIRTTRIKYFSYIEKIAIQIGDDVLEFANDVENFLINGKPVEKQRTHHKTYLGGFVVRRDQKALSIRLTQRKQNGPKIDLIQRNIGWPAVIVNGGDTDMFAGSLGLLGEWETGKKIARDGKMEMNGDDATAFALEWQVRDTEPLLFNDARAPQFPQQCTPPSKVLGNRLGMKLAREEAAKACAGWKQDKDDCIFDVIATRDVSVAAEGSIQTA